MRSRRPASPVMGRSRQVPWERCPPAQRYLVSKDHPIRLVRVPYPIVTELAPLHTMAFPKPADRTVDAWAAPEVCFTFPRLSCVAPPKSVRRIADYKLLR